MRNFIIVSFLLFFFITDLSAQKRRGSANNNASEPHKEQPQNYSCPKFREMHWGTVRDSLIINGTPAQFNKASNKSDTGAWYINDDDMVIGTVTCKQIYYYFNPAGRLNKVKLIVPKFHKGEMLYILTNKFDNPTAITDLPNGYQKIWGNINEIRLIMSYFEDQDYFTVEFISDFERDESKKINREVDDF